MREVLAVAPSAGTPLVTVSPSFSAGPTVPHQGTLSLAMAAKSNGSTSLALIPELSGYIPKVAPREYRDFTDVALDGEIVASVDAAQGHYDGLRRELVLRLLPSLAEMRRRHDSQGARNDLNRRLGLPTRAGWEDYLRSRGLKPDTVRNWFQKHAAVKTLGLLVGTIAPRKLGSQSTTCASNEPRLYRISVADRVLVVAATSARQATAIVHQSMTGLTDLDAKAEELGQVIEISNGRISKRPPRQIPQERAVSEKVILKALAENPGASPATIAKRLGVSTVDVRRVATKHRKQLSR